MDFIELSGGQADVLFPLRSILNTSPIVSIYALPSKPVSLDVFTAHLLNDMLFPCSLHCSDTDKTYKD